MAFSSADQDDNEVMSEINMIPLIDVMLVLLIVFMITAPVMKHAVEVDLPKTQAEKLHDKPHTVRLSVQADGSYWWDQSAVSDEQLHEHLIRLAMESDPVQLQIYGDQSVHYGRVAQVMAAAQQAGIRTIGFVTQP